LAKNGERGQRVSPLEEAETAQQPGWARALAMVALNLILLVALAFLAWGLYTRIRAALPCYQSTAFVLCGSVFMLALLHAVLRPVGLLLDGVQIKAGPISGALKGASDLIAWVHPTRAPYSLRWGVIGFLMVISVALFFAAGRLRTEATPAVTHFLVTYIGSPGEEAFGPRAIAPVKTGQRVRIQAKTLRERVLKCTWSSAQGRLSPAEGCATFYAAPGQETWDAVDVTVQTQCGTQVFQTSLVIQVVGSTP